MMDKMKYFISIIILSLVLFSCSKKDDGESSGSNMILSDINSNLNGNSLFVTVGNVVEECTI